LKIAVIGAGGIGGYFGGRWAEAGLDVTMVARGQHLQVIRKSGLRILSSLGNASVKVRAERHTADVGVVDFVLVATKAWQMEDALRYITPLLGKNTLVLGLQNGVEAAQQIGASVGHTRTLAGTCRIISFIEEPGVIRHAAGAPIILFGERDGGFSPRGEVVREALASGAGMTVQFVEDVSLELWRKFHWFAPLAGVGSVTRSAAGAFRSQPETRALLVAAMDEVLALAHAEGVALPATETASAMQFVDSLPADATSTMMRDFRDGKRTELETLHGTITRRASAVGVPVPVNSFIYAALLPQEAAARAAL
jgi:2-dehydropantoate 2-reductase